MEVAETLSERRCCECKRKIMVATYEPHAKAKDVTGIHLSNIDDVNNPESVGWLCWDCANTFEKKHPELEIMWGFNGDLCPPDVTIWHKPKVKKKEVAGCNAESDNGIPPNPKGSGILPTIL